MTREEAIERLKQNKAATEYYAGQSRITAEIENSLKDSEAFDMAIEALTDRPTDEWCTDCKEYDHEKHCCPLFNRVIRTTLNEAVANLKEEFESAVPNCQRCAIKELWKEAEKEDLVAVVRCEDCVWSKEWNDNQIFCDRILMRLRETDFCSYGERREE